MPLRMDLIPRVRLGLIEGRPHFHHEDAFIVNRSAKWPER